MIVTNVHNYNNDDYHNQMPLEFRNNKNLAFISENSLNKFMKILLCCRFINK